jgi:recombination associated protein RdgC
MMFKNLQLYRLPDGWSLPASELEDALARRPLRPCGAFDMETRGFVACGYEGRLLYTQAGQHLLALGTESKILPASVIRQVTRERAVALEEQLGHPPGRRQLRELKERVTDELKARALTRRRETLAWLAPGQGLLAVDAASPGAAEILVETLRDVLGTLAAEPLRTHHAPAGAMAAWLLRSDAPRLFTLDQDLELRAVDLRRSTIRYSQHALDGREIQAHLKDGKVPTRLGLIWNGRISFLLQQDYQVRRVRFLDVFEDAFQTEKETRDNRNEQFDLDFALTTGELGQLVEDLVQVLGGLESTPDVLERERAVA